MPEDIQHANDVEAAKERLRNRMNPPSDDRDISQTKLTPEQMIDIERRKAEIIKPVSAEKRHKKSFGQKLKEAIFSEDIGNGSITEHIVLKILIPSFKRVVYESCNTALVMFLKLDPGTRVLGSSSSRSFNASMTRNSVSPRQDISGQQLRMAVREYDWDEETAKDIYRQMSELVHEFGKLTLGEAYRIMGLSDLIRSTDRYWGWTTLDGVGMIEVSPGKWILDMPPAKRL